jgi:hypothetical protein
MDDPITVACPWCSEPVELWIDPETEGAMVEDCSVCCRPWEVRVTRDADGEAAIEITRAQ